MSKRLKLATRTDGMKSIEHIRKKSTNSLLEIIAKNGCDLWPFKAIKHTLYRFVFALQKEEKKRQEREKASKTGTSVMWWSSEYKYDINKLKESIRLLEDKLFEYTVLGLTEAAQKDDDEV